MKIKVDTGNTCDFYSELFIAFLRAELKSAEEYIAIACHKDDKKLNKKIAKACAVLLDYYAGER